MKLGSLFDGIGGALLAASMCEIEPVWSSEIEPFPIKVTKHHFPDVKHYGDITKINGAEIEPVDIIVGGSPCQDLSVAGKRAGLAGERSGLFMEQIRIVKEMRSATNKPRYMVWENVPGAFSSNNGEDFRAVLEETARVADPTVSIPRSVAGWANAGSILGNHFSISWRTFDAQHWGVPQRRRRIYLVADFGGQSAPEILFEQPCGDRHIAESRSEGQRVAENTERSVGEAVCYGISAYESNSMKSNNPHSGIYEADTARTIDQNGGNPVCNQGGIAVVNCFDAYQHHNWRECDKFGPLTTGVGRVRGDTPLVAGGNQVNAVCSSSLNSSAFREGSFGGYVEGEIGTLKKSGGALSGGSESLIYQPIKEKTVRRLTPLECERLQGYPDGWTDIPGASDTARYKALGNSFAIPNAYFVISKIKEVNND